MGGRYDLTIRSGDDTTHQDTRQKSSPNRDSPSTSFSEDGSRFFVFSPSSFFTSVDVPAAALSDPAFLSLLAGASFLTSVDFDSTALVNIRYLLAGLPEVEAAVGTDAGAWATAVICRVVGCGCSRSYSYREVAKWQEAGGAFPGKSRDLEVVVCVGRKPVTGVLRQAPVAGRSRTDCYGG